MYTALKLLLLKVSYSKILNFNQQSLKFVKEEKKYSNLKRLLIQG